MQLPTIAWIWDRIKTKMKKEKDVQWIKFIVQSEYPFQVLVHRKNPHTYNLKMYGMKWDNKLDGSRDYVVDADALVIEGDVILEHYVEVTN